MSFRRKARAWAKGLPVTNLPVELQDLELLQALPGYTLRELDQTPAATVNRWRIGLEEIAKEQARQTS